MNVRSWTSLFLTLACVGIPALGADEPPTEWIEPATGHRVIRLSREAGTRSLYFHQNAYTKSGDKMIVTTWGGLSVVNLKTRAVEPLVKGRVGNVIVGRETRQVYYRKEGTVYATQIDTGVTRQITNLPPELRRSSGFAVNADETLLAGSFAERRPAPADGPTAGQDQTNSAPPPRGFFDRPSLEERWAMRRPMRLFTINIQTGEIKTFHPVTDWLNHVQFSPTDPTLIMFCHEGPWHKVDRIWTIRADGSGLTQIHKRAMDMEIAGHEFFNPDGKIIWYDLQTPKGKEFWLAGYNLKTGKTIKYSVQRAEWSVHYNVSPDGKLFAGDGGGPHSVAAPGNGQWIYLFRPKRGKLEAEKLVNLSQHDYTLEPNVSFTPDGKWIVFSSNMHGGTHVYAVEVKKAK